MSGAHDEPVTDRLLTQQQLAARLGVHPDTVRRLVKAGHIKPVRIGSVVRYDPNTVIKKN
jgi:excisionase family DNA binding protein